MPSWPSRKSTTGVITFSQSGRNGIRCSNNIDCCPGPSKRRAFQPRATAGAPSIVHAVLTGPSLPLFTITVGTPAPPEVPVADPAAAPAAGRKR